MSNNRSVSLVSVKVEDGSYKHFIVPKEVSVYIKQLEAYIRNPEKSKLLTVYKNRFSLNHLRENVL